jgi:hypothetical protein
MAWFVVTGALNAGRHGRAKRVRHVHQVRPADRRALARGLEHVHGIRGRHAKGDDVVEALGQYLRGLLGATVGERLDLGRELRELVGRKPRLSDELGHRGLEVGGHLCRGRADADNAQRHVGREGAAGARHAVADGLEVSAHALHRRAGVVDELEDY